MNYIVVGTISQTVLFGQIVESAKEKKAEKKKQKKIAKKQLSC